MTTKISISLQDEALTALDQFIADKNLPSRSAAIQEAIAMMTSTNLQNAYAQAFTEWNDEQAEDWDTVSSDGIS